MRHGEPVGGSKYRGNSIDDPLSELGWSQMRAAVKELNHWDAIVTSPMLRCLAFADEISQNLTVPLKIIDDFKEVGFGEWEGKTKEQVQMQFAEEYKAFNIDPVLNRPSGAEVLQDFYDRVTLAIESVMSTYQSEKRILIITHAGVIRAAIALFTNMPLASMYKLEVSNAGLTSVLVKPDGIKLFYVNR